MRLLVTGGDGQLGRCLAERAATAPGIELIAAGRDQLDLEASNLDEMVASARPELVINAAAFTAVDAAEDDPELAMRINGLAAGRIAVAARNAGARLIHVSTDYVFDGSATAPVGEDAPLRPLGAYGRSKAEGEARARAALPEALIVRTAWVCSPYGRNFVRTMLNAARERDTLNVVADQIGSPTSALDLADALLAMARSWREGGAIGPGGTYHVVNGGQASWFEVATHIMAEAAKRGLPSAGIRPITSDQWPARAPRPAYSVLDPKRLRDDFGIALQDWRPAFATIVERIAEAGRCA